MEAVIDEKFSHKDEQLRSNFWTEKRITYKPQVLQQSLKCEKPERMNPKGRDILYPREVPHNLNKEKYGESKLRVPSK